MQDLFSFENFILNTSKLTKSNFDVLNSFLEDFISKIDSQLTPSPKLVHFSSLWRQTQDSGRSLGFDQSSTNQTSFEGGAHFFFGDFRMAKVLKKVGGSSFKEFFNLLSEWLSTVQFDEISESKFLTPSEVSFRKHPQALRQFEDGGSGEVVGLPPDGLRVEELRVECD